MALYRHWPSQPYRELLASLGFIEVLGFSSAVQRSLASSAAQRINHYNNVVMGMTVHPKKDAAVGVRSLVVKRLAPDKYRYFFQFQNLSDQSAEVRIRIRIYPRFFRLLCGWTTFRLTLPAYGFGTGSIDLPYLYKQPRFQWKTSSETGSGIITDVREDLSLMTHNVS